MKGPLAGRITAGASVPAGNPDGVHTSAIDVDRIARSPINGKRIEKLTTGPKEEGQMLSHDPGCPAGSDGGPAICTCGALARWRGGRRARRERTTALIGAGSRRLG